MLCASQITVLDGHPLKLCDMFLVHIQGYVKVGSAVSCFKCGYKGCVLQGVWMSDVTELEVKLKASAAFVPT